MAIILMEKYRILQKEQEEAFRALGKVWEKMEKENPVMVEKTIDEAVKLARNV